MKQLFVLALVTVMAQSSVALAKGAIAQPSGGYGMAGCGLGSLVFKENNSTQILAATTNGTFGSQTFGITFGTSNCDKAGALVSKEQVQNYIAANEHALKTDIARGNGETVNGLAKLMNQDQTQFGAILKANYSKLFAKKNVSAQELTDSVYGILN